MLVNKYNSDNEMPHSAVCDDSRTRGNDMKSVKKTEPGMTPGSTPSLEES